MKRETVLAGGFLVVLAMLAVAGPMISGVDYDAIDLRARLAPPLLYGGGIAHPFGTDDLGRDVLLRVLYATRITLVVACLATTIGAVIGILAGTLAAHFRGWVDDLLVVAIDFQAALPYLLLVLAAITVFGRDPVLFVAVLGLHGWERFARLARGMALSAQQQGYAVAVRGLGASALHLYRQHLLPNMAGTLITNCTLALPQVILLESSLSFLGVGVQAPQTSLGTMVGLGRDYLRGAWWIAAAPASVIFLISVAIGTLGNAMTERLDPSLRPR